MRQQNDASTATRSLSTLIDVLRPSEVTGNDRPEILGVSHDSRLVEPGDLFVAIAGLHTDGVRHIDQALARGASAVVSERALVASVPCLRVANARTALGEASAWFYGDPSRLLKLIGVTGTNGKTTTCYLIKAILERAGVTTGLIGSVENYVGTRRLPSRYTTPDPPELHSLLAKMVASGGQRSVMEVSSHALAQDRVASCQFDTVIFTNLTHDHLDFHKSFENYRDAKGKLFAELVEESTRRIINCDDSYGRELISKAHSSLITYGLHKDADVRAENITAGMSETAFTVNARGDCHRFTLPLIGLFNVSNALAAIAYGLSAGVSLDVIAEAFATFPGVPGRQQPIDCGQAFSVFIDYAHTPDGLDQMLRAMRALTKGKLLTVFGCTGDRDVSKRPVMGEIAARWSDFVFVTSDDPHNENPGQIIEQIEQGILHRDKRFGSDYLLEADRARAVEAALCMAEPGDVVLIAGKGHESVQIFKNQIVSYSDERTVREILAVLMAQRSAG